MNPGSIEQMGGKSPTAESPGWLWLDPEGRIRACTPGAHVLGGGSPTALVGTPLASHLAWDVTSQDPDWQQAQWEVLRGNSVGRDLRVATSTDSEREVLLRLEAAEDATGGYFATVSDLTRHTRVPSAPPPPTVPAPTPTPESPADFSPVTTWLAGDAPAGLFELNFPASRARFSLSLRRLLGYEGGGMADSYAAWLELLHPEDSAAAPHRVSKRPPFSGTRSLALEFRMRHRDGRYLWMQCLGLQVFNAAGELEQALGFLVDITDRKELEEEALTASDRLRRISEHGQLGLFDLDFGGQHYWFSDTWLRLLGLPAAEPGSQPDPLSPLLDVMPPGRAPSGVSTWLASHRPEEEPLIEATTLIDSGGRVIPVLLGVSRQFSRRRDLSRAVGFAIPLCGDAGRLRESKPLPPPHLVAPVMDSLSEAVIVADAEGSVVFMNTRAEALTGRSIRQGGLMRISQAFPLVTLGHYQVDHDAVERHLASPDPLPLRTEHALAPLPDRSEPLPIVWSARPSWDEKGRIAGVIIVFRDPQEMSLTPEELIRANRLETLGSLASGIATDYTNLLTTILGAISQAKEHRDFSHLANAEGACLEATTLSRQLIAFATDSTPARRTVCAVSEILRDAVRIATTGSLATVAVDAPANLPSIEVDRAQMLQVFQNLVLNAIEALPAELSAGHVRVRAATVVLAEGEVPPLPAGAYVQVDVQDNGRGIPPENLERIFTPFFTTKPHGTGLGLATVLSVLRNHGGQVWVSSLPDAGSTFTVYLPAVVPATEPASPRLPSLPFGTGRILFMDDDPHISALTASMLQSLDYTFDLARDGEETLSLYRRYLNVGRPYDAVVMDLTVIGGMGGEECLQRLRELHPEVRAIVSTGYDDPSRRHRYADLGFAGFLAKPYRVGDLSRALRAVLGDLEPPFAPDSPA